MSSNLTSALPLNIGITGHRDIPKQDEPLLEAAISQELTRMKKRYPNTTINILCGLAQGADQLVAKIALSLNLNVIAVLPFEQSEYEKDFDSPQALEEFRTLLAKCSDTIVCVTTPTTARHEGYVELGRTLVRCCDVVFALWDGHTETDDNTGRKNPLPGGTSDVIHMCVEGIMDENSLLFAKPNQTYCKWLVTNQSKNDDLPKHVYPINEIGTWKKLPIEGNQDEKILQNILGKIERFNKDASNISQQEEDASVEYLLGSVEAKQEFTEIKKLIDTYSLADCLAQVRQKQRILSLKTITFLSFLAIAAQQLYAGLYATLGWFTTHFMLVLIVVVIYRVFFAGSESKEEQFVEWRVFAENLRVQIFWYIAGMSDHCANNYRTTKLNEMDWIVDNLNKLTITIKAPSKANVDFVRKHWVADQRDYFYGKEGKSGRAAELLAKSKQYKIGSLIFFLLALISMVLSTIKIELDFYPSFDNDAMFFIIALLFIASALLKTFSEQMGFEEISHRYTRTGYFFQQALNRMVLLDKKSSKGQAIDIEKYQSVIKIIGVEALSENAAWLQLYKMNAYQVQIN